MSNNYSHRRWFILLAVVFILSMVSACLYANVSEDDMSTCSSYRACEGS